MKKSLWLTLEAYNFHHVVPASLRDRIRRVFGASDASLQAFAAKLATKLDWDIAFALRAIEEYKKYLFLGAISPTSVTPSRVIDQVWHEHILFTRAYREFCKDVLGHPFDHDPELISVDEQTGVFQLQYLATLDLYSREFGYDPPDDIWGMPKFMRRDFTTGHSKPRAKRLDGVADALVPESTPLHQLFDSSTDAQHHLLSLPDSTHFGGSGGFGGGGSGQSWGDGHGDHVGGDSGGADAGGASGGGGSGCSSSSCGGGGCGGGGE
jgi:hypothetical protein